ncbi:MAG: Stk1 family PASTA domain-containing Ser/Thr kinase [Oscillospiraceae bacterium]
MDNYIGKRIEGRYEIIELIGVGGMANVYKAIDITDEKTVAVKILREEYYSNEEFLRRFKNESKAIAVLSHPNIIKVYDVCFSNRMQSIVMEYIDGITLKEYMDQQGTLSWKETLHFMLQILCALSHAHEKGIVHRDMKPQNVMLLPDGHIKITDFGIARFARSETKTLTDRAIGSVHYISPEQARGEHTDQRADIYSVGVMMFEMLTGQLPFDAESPVSVALKQIQLEAPSPRSLRPDIPEGLEDITVRAMQKDPDQRYQSASEMLRDIELFKQNPSAHFEYQYLSNQRFEDERFRRAIKNARQGNAEVAHASAHKPHKGEQRVSKQSNHSNHEHEKDDYAQGHGASVLAVLAGITAAFVVISMAFIGTMLYLNNPLEKVQDVKLPDLTGLKYESVRNASEYQSLVIEVDDSQYNDLYERGAIIEQSPKAGKTVKVGSTVKVTLSNGQKIVTMPNLIGMEETQAIQKLSELELEYQRQEIFSDSVAAGMVASTEPGRDSEMSAGTIVRLQISMGPENKVVEVPTLVGQTQTAARAALEALGLEVGGVSYVVSDKPYDTVVAQDPAATSQIATGSFVNLNVSGGEDQQNTIQLPIRLPEGVTDIVVMSALYDGQVLKEEKIQPSVAHYWRPTLQGTGTVTINILYNNFLYITYEVDFSNASYRVLEDNTAQHISTP